MPRTDVIVNVNVTGIGIDFQQFVLTIYGYEIDEYGSQYKNYSYNAPLNDSQKQFLSSVIAEFAGQYKVSAGIETESELTDPVYGPTE